KPRLERPGFVYGQSNGCRIPGRQVGGVSRLDPRLNHMLDQIAWRAKPLLGQACVVIAQPSLQFSSVRRQCVQGRPRRRWLLLDRLRLHRQGRTRQGRRPYELALLRIVVHPLRRQSVEVSSDAELDGRSLERITERRFSAVAL